MEVAQSVLVKVLNYTLIHEAHIELAAPMTRPGVFTVYACVPDCDLEGVSHIMSEVSSNGN